MVRRVPMFGFASIESALEHRRHVRSERAKGDLQQTVFCQTEDQGVAIKGNPHKFATITEKGIDPFKNTTCPFCLSYSKLRLFLISTKKGFNRGLGKCPVCSQGVRLQTLVRMEKWSAKEYAAWVFEYRSSGFWQKINWVMFKKHLKLMGWERDFFDEYKRLKGDLPDAQQQREFDDKWADYEESFN